MKKHTKSFAAKLREAGRRACREYCDQLPAVTRWPSLLLPCWKCQKAVRGKDCHGNEIGTREALIAAARARVIELPPSVGHERNKTE
jgi:hypothetical protein